VTSDEAGDGTFRLIYRSRSQVPPDQRKTELGALFTQARSNNKRRDITGALLLSGDWFVQTLEGDELKVRSLFSTIEQDSRHDSVTVLQTEHVPARVFPRWSMAEVTDAAEETYLIAHEDGIAPAAGRPTSPEQQAVLDTMRDSARRAAPTA
jgi:hypothetical protein